jgi:hypothetical protein
MTCAAGAVVKSSRGPGNRVEQDERLRSSFGAAAAVYAEHRPDYARAAVRWALERAPGSWRAETADAHLPGLGHLARFGSPEQAEFPHGHRRTADSLVATLATKAAMLVMPGQRAQAGLAQLSPGAQAGLG